MKITCDSCGAKYTIADDKVSGRKVKIRCKGCGTPIVVDGAAKASGAPAAAEANPARTDSQIPVEPAPSSAPPAAEWSVNLSETDQRTMSTAELVSGWKSGAVTTDAFVWKEGMSDWLPILECAELTALLNAAPAAAEPKPAAQPAVRAGSTRPIAAARTGGRVQVGTDLFAGAAASGSESEEVNTSAPVLPQGARGDDGKPTGQRNENSVLFSLDALKAGFAGPPAKAEAPKRGATVRGAAADDPFGLGGGAVAAAPMFSMADNAALLTAPPPPEPPKPVIAFAEPGAPAQARGSKKGMIIGVVAVLLVGGIGAAFALSAKAEKEELIAAAAAASASAEKAREEERKARAAEEKAREEQKEEAAKATAAAVAAAEAAAKAASDDKSGDDKKDPAAAAGAKSGAPAAKKDDKKDAPAPAAGGDQPFNKSAAISSLGAAAGGAAGCKKLGGPTGSGKVTVTFAPSGRVTTANVNGAPFAGTSVGGCVASIFRKAKVPPFSGSPVTVSKGFSIN
jgi:predicted Zn finger-like uncharacterized protein